MSSVPKDLHQADFEQLNAELKARGWELIRMALGTDHIRLDFRSLNPTPKTAHLMTTGHDFANARANVLKLIEQETSSPQ